MKNYRLPILYMAKDEKGKPTVRPGSKWYVFYYYRNPVTDLFERIKVSGGLNKLKTIEERKIEGKEIVLKYTEMLTALNHNPFKKNRHVTSEFKMADLIKDYQSERNGEIVENTYRNEKLTLDRLLEFSGETAVAEIDKDIIKNYLKSFYKKNNWSATTYNKYLTQIKNFFDFVIDRKDPPIDKNPATGIKNKPAKSEANPPLSDKELEEILKYAAEHEPYFLFFYSLMYYTCFRPTREARLLQVKDIDLGQNVINVQKKNSKTGKKLGVGRTVELPQQLLDIFNEQKVFDYPPDYYVFSLSRTPGPKCVSINFFAEKWRSVRKGAGLSLKVKMYAIKHTRVCHLVLDGEALYRIQGQTGHTTLAQLMIYLKGLKLIVDKGVPLITRKL